MSNNGKAKIFYHEIMVVWHNTVLQCGKKWAWPVKHFLACAACGLLPPRSKNPSYAPDTCPIANPLSKQCGRTVFIATQIAINPYATWLYVYLCRVLKTQKTIALLYLHHH